MKSISIATLVLLMLVSPVFPCTCFQIVGRDTLAIGQSYDWHSGAGVMVVNPRGLKKQAFPLSLKGEGAKWTSKNASITFCQHGEDFPIGGMNEKGLAIQVLWLSNSTSPKQDERKTVNELQWVQYQLDNFDTVADVQRAKDEIRISRIAAPVHYFVCDKTGACAVFETIDGKWAAVSGGVGPAAVIANDTYKESVDYMQQLQDFGGTQRLPKDFSSLTRFARAAKETKQQYDGMKSLRERTFEVLNTVKNDETRFQIVYEPMDSMITFHSTGAASTMSISLKDFTPEMLDGKTGKQLAIDLGSKIDGHLKVSDLSSFTPQWKLSLLQAGLKEYYSRQ